MLPPDLVAKLNECANSHFADERDLWFLKQSVSSWFVIIGLVLEGPELWYETLSIIRKRIARFRYRILLLESRIELAKIAAIVGWIFIIGGLLGELRASSKIADLSAHIEECSDAKVRKATIEAGDAGTSAQNAEDSAKVAGDQAKRAKEEADEVTRQAKELSQYVGVLARSVNPRRLDCPKFVELLTGQPKEVADIWYEPDDWEATVFAQQLADCIRNNDKILGWTFTLFPFPSHIEPGFLATLLGAARSNGLAYGAREYSPNLSSPVQKLWNAVETSVGGWGIGNAVMWTGPEVPENHIWIAVGRHRPNIPVVQFNTSTKPKAKTQRKVKSDP